MNAIKITAATMLVLANLQGWATPLQKGDVPADPYWVIHLDCDKLRPTALGQFLLAEMDKPEAQTKIASFTAIFNFDPRQQLHAVTLYGTGNRPEDGVCLVYADVDPARLETLAKGAKDYQSTTYKQFVIHNWIDDKPRLKSGQPHRTYAAIYGNKVVAFGQKESQVALALDVLSKQTLNLDSASLWPFTAEGADYVQAFARKMNLPDTDPNAAIFRLTKMLRFQMGEAQGQAKAVMTFSADNEEVASHLTSIANGLVALMKYQKTKPETSRLAEALTLKQEAEQLVVTAGMSATELIDLIKAGAAKKAAKPN